MSNTDTGGKPTPVEKAAIFLMTLGEDEAGKVLKNMGPKDVQKIGLAMSNISNVQRDAVDGVLDEFFNAVGSQLAWEWAMMTTFGICWLPRLEKTRPTH